MEKPYRVWTDCLLVPVRAHVWVWIGTSWQCREQQMLLLPHLLTGFPRHHNNLFAECSFFALTSNDIY